MALTVAETRASLLKTTAPTGVWSRIPVMSVGEGIYINKNAKPALESGSPLYLRTRNQYETHA